MIDEFPLFLDTFIFLQFLDVDLIFQWHFWNHLLLAIHLWFDGLGNNMPMLSFKEAIIDFILLEGFQFGKHILSTGLDFF